MAQQEKDTREPRDGSDDEAARRDPSTERDRVAPKDDPYRDLDAGTIYGGQSEVAGAEDDTPAADERGVG